MSASPSRTGLAGRLASWLGSSAAARNRASTVGPPDPPTAPARPPGTLAWFRLCTLKGRVITVAEGDTPWLRIAASADPARACLLVTSSAHPHLCLIVAPGPDGLSVWPGAAPAQALAARLMPTDTAGIVRLRDPLATTTGFLCLRAPATEMEPDIAFDGAGLGAEAAFGLLPVTRDALTALVAAVSDEFAAVLAAGLTGMAVLAHLRAGRLRAGLAEAVLRLLPHEELAELARTLLAQEQDLALLADLLPEDGWLRTALPALRHWQAKRAPASAAGTAASSAGDEVLLLPLTRETGMPLGLVLNSLARRSILPRRGACVLATARNEGAYLLDWVAYHLAIGFEHVFLYSNDNADGSDTLLAALAAQGVITWIANERGTLLGPQVKAYAHALTMLPQILDYRWAAVLDLDEYLAFDTGMFASLPEFLALQENQPADAVGLCWLMFASLPGERWSAEPSWRRMTRREGEVNSHVKTLFRPRLFWHSQPHYPSAVLNAAFDFRTQDGSVHHHRAVAARLPAFAEAPSARQAWVNHYFLRTAEEALWKWARGRADWTDESERAWFLDFVATSFLDLARPERLVEDRRILGCAAGQPAVLDRLLALPGVAAADAEIKAQYAGRLQATRDAFLAVPPAVGEPRAVAFFRDMLKGDTP